MGLNLYCNKLTSTTNFSSCNYVQPCPCLLFGLHDIEWPSDDLPSVLTWSSEKRPQFRFFCMHHYYSSFSIVLSTNTFLPQKKGNACLEEGSVMVLHFLALALAPLIESCPLTTTFTYWFSLPTKTDKSVRLFSTTSGATTTQCASSVGRNPTSTSTRNRKEDARIDPSFAASEAAGIGGRRRPPQKSCFSRKLQRQGSRRRSIRASSYTSSFFSTAQFLKGR